MTTARTVARQTALTVRLLQLLRRQITRTKLGNTGQHLYHVFEGKPLNTLEARRLERDDLLKWVAPLDERTYEEVAHLTHAGEKQLAALNAFLPDRLKDPVQHVLSMLGLLTMRKEQYAAEKAQAISEHHWNKVAGLDGILTGLIIAEGLLRDEIRHLTRELQVDETLKAA